VISGEADEDTSAKHSAPAGGRSLRLYELAVSAPLLAWIVFEATTDHRMLSPAMLAWAAAIAVVDLLPLPISADKHFSLSFPLQLSTALLYSPWVATAIAFLGTTDRREIRHEITILKGLFIRAQIAVSVAAEAYVFHGISTLHSHWWTLGGAVLLATLVGYGTNVLLVACYERLRSGMRVAAAVKEMHHGIFGELVLTYTGLAIFGVIIAVFFAHNEAFLAVVVFVAPLALARQMFARTHSLQLVTEELELRQGEIEHQARHDVLTELPNRVLFAERLRGALSEWAPGGHVAVIVMDLDQFKEVNDALGHHFGDLLLKQVGARLRNVMRDEDTVARLGGDEFGILLPRVSTLETVVQVAERVSRVLAPPIALEGLTLEASASMGIALYPDHGSDLDTLLRRADVAMYTAKERRTGHEVYSADHDPHAAARLALVGQVRPAITSREFVLHFQPQAAFSDGSVSGAEALIRWQHPKRGLLMPEEFIPLTERTVLLRPLTLFVIEEALRHCCAWREAGHDLPVAVNLSPHSLLDMDLPEKVAGLLEQSHLPASSLRLEITESSMTGDSVRSLQVISRLHAVGVGLSIDDFGTGYSSLGYLKRLPVDEIKVDKSFVMNMETDPNDATIVKATIDLSHNLGLRVVAEGVETLGTWSQLRALECDVAQGFLVSRPIPGSEMLRWLDDGRERMMLVRSGASGGGSDLDREPAVPVRVPIFRPL